MMLRHHVACGRVAAFLSEPTQGKGLKIPADSRRQLRGAPAEKSPPNLMDLVDSWNHSLYGAQWM